MKTYPTLHCIVCEEIIDPIKVRKAGPRRQPLHCSTDCAVESRKRAGFFARMGALGNASQHAAKEKDGVIPGYEHRKAALIASNKERPRRAKTAK